MTEFPANVFIDGVYCDGAAAFMGPVSGFPGNVYRITVYVPTPAVLFATTGTQSSGNCDIDCAVTVLPALLRLW